MSQESHFTLPPKADGSRYSMRELLAAVDEDFLRYYNESYRLAMALSALQHEVEKALDGPQRRTDLLPESAQQAMDAQDVAAYESIELKQELQQVQRRYIRHIDKRQHRKPDEENNDWFGDNEVYRPVRDMRGMREALNDPLRMARKHVTDLLYERIRGDMDFLERMDERMHPEDNARNSTAADVQQLMMLMADNAVMHGQRQGRLV